jgi:CysZ protein
MPSKNTLFNDVLKGLTSYFQTFGLLHKLKLWKYFGVPLLISVFTGIVILATLFFFAEGLGHQFTKLWPFSFAQETISGLSHLVGALFILSLGLVLFKHIVMAFSAPFMSPVSEKIEAYYLASLQKEPNTIKNFSSSLVRGIKINLRNIGREILFIIPLFILSLLPVTGIVCSLLMLVIQAYYAGFGTMDYTLERHYNYKNSIRFVQKHRGIAIGNGLGFMLLLLIPVIGIIIVFPLSVVAATKNTVAELHKNTIK